MNKSWKVFLQIVAVALFIINIYGLYLLDSVANRNSQQEYISSEETNLQDSVLNAIFELRLEHPYIVYAQALVESGHFQSAIFLQNNNMFGMRMPERRATLALGIRRGHAYYRSWRDCLYDYAMFQSAYMRGLSEDEYFTKLSKSYAEDKEYEKKVRLLKEAVKKKVQ